MLRLLALSCLVALGLAPSALAAKQPPPAGVDEAKPAKAQRSWAELQIQSVVDTGLMAATGAEFRPDEPLTWADLADVLVALGGTPPAIADPARPVRVRDLDAQLVGLLGLSDAARQITASLAAAGLVPPARSGAETVARMLGLRFNHPKEDDVLELGPNDPVTRAEAAYSLAAVLELSGADLSWVDAKAQGLVFGQLTDWQRQVLARAMRFVGYPYIWGGSSEKTQAPFAVRVPGGFDCSGFVWRVYKLEPFEGGAGLGDVLQGRTSYAMSGEVARAKRIPFAELQPGDVLFFGDRGPRSKPRQVGHVGIYVAPGWMVHSSRYGTTLAPLEGWYLDEFAWARRPLAEAGVS